MAGWFCEFTGPKELKALQTSHGSLNPPTSWIIQSLLSFLLLFSSMSGALYSECIWTQREREGGRKDGEGEGEREEGRERET